MSKKKISTDLITPEQVEEIEYTVRDHMYLIDRMLKELKFNSLNELPKSMYRNTIERLRLIVRYSSETSKER